MKCTKCNSETDSVRSDQFKNVNGKMVRLIPEGEKWCVKCCSNLDNLSSLNEGFLTSRQRHVLKMIRDEGDMELSGADKRAGYLLVEKGFLDSYGVGRQTWFRENKSKKQ